MTALTRWRRTVTFAAAFVGLCVPARAETFPECARRAYAQAASASQEWQYGLRDLIVKMRPDLGTVATLEMEHQLARIDRRHSQFRYLIQTDARRVQTREGLTSFRNFDWTDADARVLRQQNADYIGIERKVVELERQGQARRDWPALRDYVRTSLSASAQFQALLKRLRERERGIGQLLESCQLSRGGADDGLHARDLRGVRRARLALLLFTGLFAAIHWADYLQEHRYVLSPVINTLPVLALAVTAPFARRPAV